MLSLVIIEPAQHLRVLRQHYEHLAKYTDEQLASVITASGGDWRELEDAACDCDSRLLSPKPCPSPTKKGASPAPFFFIPLLVQATYLLHRQLKPSETSAICRHLLCRR